MRYKLYNDHLPKLILSTKTLHSCLVMRQMYPKVDFAFIGPNIYILYGKYVSINYITYSNRLYLNLVE